MTLELTGAGSLKHFVAEEGEEDAGDADVAAGTADGEAEAAEAAPTDDAAAHDDSISIEGVMVRLTVTDNDGDTATQAAGITLDGTLEETVGPVLEALIRKLNG